MKLPTIQFLSGHPFNSGATEITASSLDLYTPSNDPIAYCEGFKITITDFEDTNNNKEVKVRGVPTTGSVPEPGSMFLTGFGLLFIVASRGRFLKSA